MTKSEGLRNEYLPGEFLWGLGVQVGLVPGQDLDDHGLYGFYSLFAYETEHMLVGTQANLRARPKINTRLSAPSRPSGGSAKPQADWVSSKVLLGSQAG